MPTSTEFYQRLSTIIKAESIPGNIAILEDGAQTLLDKLFFADAIIQRSASGDAGYAHLRIITGKELGFGIGGTNGIRLLLNPNPSGTGSSFPLNLTYEWKILKYKSSFNFSSFNNSISGIFEVFKDLAQISNDEFLLGVLRAFLGGNNSVADFIFKFNTFYNTGYQLKVPSEFNSVESVFEILEKFDEQNINLFEVIYDLFLAESLSLDEFWKNIKRLFQSWIDRIDEERLLDIITPKFNFVLESINAAIEFPEKIFTPIDPDIPKSLLTFDIGSLEIDSQKGFDFKSIGNLSFTESKIGNTDFTIGFTNAKLDLSRTKNIPEAIADGRPEDFMGVYIQNGVISFPAEWGHNEDGSTGELFVRNLLAGTGGLSGTIGLRAKTEGEPSPFISLKLGDNFIISLDTFSLTFQQNAIIGSDISGTLTLNINDEETVINILVHIGQKGEFNITAIPEEDITISLGKLAEVVLKSISLGKRNGRFYLAASGALNFKEQESGSFLEGKLPKNIEVQKILIWDDGQVEFEGGTIELREPFTLKLGPAALTITALGFGSHEQKHGGIDRKYKFFEFSGGISVSPGGVDARGDGIKVYFTVDNDPDNDKPFHTFVRIQGIAIDIIIPGSAKPEDASLLLHGYLAMREPKNNTGDDAGTEYAGGIDFSLPKLKMGGSAQMRYNPKVPAFVIDIGLELSSPIVLGSTGLGIYGFRALFGQHYIVSKEQAGVTEESPWWQYYKAKVDPENREGVTISKMADEDGLSLGAGVSLATATDGGKAFSSKIFFLLSLPEVFLLQGQAQILKERIGLDTTEDPPFFALLSISKKSVELAFGVNYKLPESGKIATVDALIEMGYFFADSSAWYINIGRELPEEMRVRARLFTLIDAYFYFMLSGNGIRAGAGASMEVKKEFGPLKAELSAYLDVAGRISFKPKQKGGSIQLGGAVGLYIFSFGFRISFGASLAAEAPKPFMVTGSIEVCIKVLKKERCAHFEFSWVYENSLDTTPIPLLAENLDEAAKALNIMSRETFAVHGITGSSIPAVTDPVWNEHIIPLDSYIDIEFKKGVLPQNDAQLHYGGVTSSPDFTSWVAPQRGKSNRVKHEFILNNLKIQYWDGAQWSDYNMYEAVTSLQDETMFPGGTFENRKYGYWQVDKPGTYNKLRILAQDPISYITQGSGNLTPENFGMSSEALFCADDPIPPTCINFDHFLNPNPGNHDLMPQDMQAWQNGVLLAVRNGDGLIVTDPYQQLTRALQLGQGEQLEYVFTEEMATVSLIVKSDSLAKVRFYKRITLAGTSSSGMPLYGYQLIETRNVPETLNTAIVYNDPEAPVSKVVIEGGDCKPRETTEPNDPKLVCDPKVTQDADDLLRFLGELAKSGDLTVTETKLFPDKFNVNDRVYFNTKLHGQPKEHEVIKLKSKVNTNHELELDITDELEFDSKIKIKPKNSTGSYEYHLIKEFKNLRPDPEFVFEGENKNFLVDAIQANGTLTTLAGTSKYTVQNCRYVCYTHVYQLCYLTLDASTYNENIPSQSSIDEGTEAMIAGIQKSLIPIWRPNTHYAIKIDVSDKVYEESSLLQDNNANYTFLFKTAGPVGHFHEFETGNEDSEVRTDYQALINKDLEDQYKLDKLLHYIDFSKSYPNADGNLINAKPLFYSHPTLLLFYRYAYVYEFFQDWEDENGNIIQRASLEMVVKDPAERPLDANGDPTVAPLARMDWDRNDIPVIPEDISALNNLIQNSIGNQDLCVQPADPLTPIGINTRFDPGMLEPLKLYTAIFNSRFKNGSNTEVVREIHRYVFQTSRYATFRQQINSYTIQEDGATKRAIFTIAKKYPHFTINKAQQVLGNTLPKTDPLMTEAAISFDRLIDRVLKLTPIEAPVTMEFNWVKNSLDGKLLGVWIRNPEPFNDPKMPESVLATTIHVEHYPPSDVHTPPSDIDFVSFFSKDRASVFVTTADLLLDLPTSGSIRFRFDYLTYNGQSYALADPLNDRVQVSIALNTIQ